MPLLLGNMLQDAKSVKYIAHVSVDRLTLNVLLGQVPGPGVRGRPRESWESAVLKDLAEYHKQLVYLSFQWACIQAAE